MMKNNRLLQLLKIFMQICSIVAFFLTLLNTNSINDDYSIIFLWPLGYIFFSFLVFGYNTQIRDEHVISISFFTLLGLFPRYVLYPVTLCFTNEFYKGIQQVSMTTEDVHFSILMGFASIVVLSIFLWFIEHSKRGNVSRGQLKDLSLLGNKWFYYLYIFFAIVVYIVIGRQYVFFQSAALSIENVEINSSVYTTLVRQVVSIGLCIFALLVISKMHVAHSRTSKNRYAFYAVFSAALYTAVSMGESRGTQIAIGVLMCIILVESFPRLKKPIIIIMGIAVVYVVALITLFRTGSTSIISGYEPNQIASMLQVYFGGPSSIAAAINVLREKVGLQNLFFDWIRSIFPFNLFLKGLGYTTSQLYNLTLYNGMFLNGQVVFGEAYSALYFTEFGCWINGIINIKLMLKTNEVFYRSSSLEIKYLSGYCLIRLIQAGLTNTPSILGSVTQMIGTFGLIIVLSKWSKRNQTSY